MDERSSEKLIVGGDGKRSACDIGTVRCEARDGDDTFLCCGILDMDCDLVRECWARLLLDAEEARVEVQDFWLLLELYVAVVKRGGGVDFCCLERRLRREDFSGMAISGSLSSCVGVGRWTSVRNVGGV